MLDGPLHQRHSIGCLRPWRVNFFAWALRRQCLAPVLIAVVQLCAPAYAQAQQPGAAPYVSKEYQIKAAFIYSILKFVEWPASSYVDANDPIVIGVFGESPFGDQLDLIVKDRKINGRSIVIKQIAAAKDIKSLHLLFFGASDDKQVKAATAGIRGTPVLTVGESMAFVEAGGIVNFVVANDKVRFEINMGEADRAGLKISAQLQKLATNISRTP